jgi:hypothetical protein
MNALAPTCAYTVEWKRVEDSVNRASAPGSAGDMFVDADMSPCDEPISLTGVSTSAS